MRHARALGFLLLYVASVAVRWWVNADRVNPGHGDVADYFEVARNLANGRGFVVDYVWLFLHEPSGIPAPSNTWWMPLPSILGAIAMVIGGNTEYATAKWAMILIASALPLLVWLTARVLEQGEPIAWAAAIFAVGFHLFLDQTCATLSYGPYALFGGGALAVIAAARKRPRILPLAGALLGLSYLSRGDSLVLLAPLLLVFWLSRRSGAGAGDERRIEFRTLALTLAAFAVVCLPWWVRNSIVLGSPTPAGQSKMIWLTDYTWWYTARPELLTPRAYFEELGWLGIYDQKAGGLGNVLSYTLECLYRSIARPEVLFPLGANSLLWIVGFALTPFLWLGCGVLLKRGLWLPFLYLLLLLGFYGVLFTALCDQSFRTGLFSLLPTFVVAIVVGFDVLISPLLRGFPRARAAALLAFAIVAAAVNVAGAKPFLAEKARGADRTIKPFALFKHWAERAKLDDETFFTLSPWEFTVATGIKSVKIPPDDAQTIVEIARKLDARFLIDQSGSWGSLTDLIKGVRTLVTDGRLKPIPSESGFQVYRFDPALFGTR